MQTRSAFRQRTTVNVYIGRAWRFIVVPLLWTAAWILDGDLALVWLAVLGFYTILISLMAIMNVPDENNLSQTTLWARKLFWMIGPLAWGGFLAVVYWLAYALTFHFEDFNAR